MYIHIDIDAIIFIYLCVLITKIYIILYCYTNISTCNYISAHIIFRNRYMNKILKFYINYSVYYQHKYINL